MIKFLLTAVVAQLAVFSFAQETPIIHRLLIHPSSSVSINGETNINKYECEIESYHGTDTLLLTAERGKGAQFKNGVAKLRATEFKCSPKVISKDFQEILKAEKHPYIQIKFVSFERIPKYESTPEKFEAKLLVSLADKSVPAHVRCSIVKDEKSLIHLQGHHKFKFADFGLVAPTKMMGMVKVHEKITVNFHLVLSQIK